MAGQNGNVYKAELEGIRAPLGIILYLIKRDNLDVYDIPIAKVTQDYVEYLDVMEHMHIDLAGEFFVLAATLMRIKAQMLLRRDDEEEDPRQELVQNIIEYKKMVEAARAFQEMEAERRRVFPRAVPQREKEYRTDPELDLNLFEIMRAFRQIMAEFEAIEVAEIELEEFTLEQKIDTILERVDASKPIRFGELFSGSLSRLEIVVTFMALLELIRQRVVRVRQEDAFGELWLYRSTEPYIAPGAEPAVGGGS